MFSIYAKSQPVSEKKMTGKCIMTAYTLWAKSFADSKINAFSRFTQKFMMAAKMVEKLYLPKSDSDSAYNLRVKKSLISHHF